MTFEQLGLRPELLSALTAKGYEIPTPIQAQAIPPILDGSDVMGGAQTGTGKTAAFTLPLLHLLMNSNHAEKRPRALILTPTRELAAQVDESVRTYGGHLPLKSSVIFGGVGMEPQKAAIRRGVDIVVATPGRLLDHCNQKTIDLSRVEILVLDEADRMLDMGFIHDIKRILALLPKVRQNLLFSATFSPAIKKLADGILRNPILVETVRHNTAAETVEQMVYPVHKTRKKDLLKQLITEGEWKQVLVFTRTKGGANQLATYLNKANIPALAIHGNKSQNARTKALAEFKAGEIRVLTATDIAARGLDIDKLPHVVNYDLPNVPEDYVHRIGRTGRAGSEGVAVSLIGAEDVPLLRPIERLLKCKIESELIPGYQSAKEIDPDSQLPPRASRTAGSGNYFAGRGSSRSTPKKSGATSSGRGNATGKPRVDPSSSNKPRSESKPSGTARTPSNSSAKPKSGGEQGKFWGRR